MKKGAILPFFGVIVYVRACEEDKMSMERVRVTTLYVWLFTRYFRVLATKRSMMTTVGHALLVTVQGVCTPSHYTQPYTILYRSPSPESPPLRGRRRSSPSPSRRRGKRRSSSRSFSRSPSPPPR